MRGETKAIKSIKKLFVSPWLIEVIRSPSNMIVIFSPFKIKAVNPLNNSVKYKLEKSPISMPKIILNVFFN